MCINFTSNDVNNWYRPDAVDFIEWLHNGISRKMESGVTVLALLINPLEVGDAGEYICVVHFVDRQPQVSSAVFLNIYSK